MPTKTAEPAADRSERTKPPFLRRVRIRGYKSIASCDVALEPLTILVGRNGSGKSNFLDALAFLRDVMAGGVTEAVKRRGGWSAIACRTSTAQGIEFEIEAGVTCARPSPQIGSNGPSDRAQSDVEGKTFSAKYHLRLSTNAHSVPLLDRETLEITDASNQRIAGFTMSDGMIDHTESMPEPEWIAMLPQSKQLFRSDHALLSMIGTQPIIDTWAGMRHMAFYNFLPEAMRRPQPPQPGRLLDQNGWNLASVLANTRQNDEKTIERIGRYLSVITESVELLDVAKYGDYETVRFRVARNGQGQPLELDAASMSDGTLRALAALVAAFQIVLPHGYPTLVAIEEPETALHPAAMRALVDALDEATLRTQVLLTTHSADMLDNPTIRPENVRVVEMIDGQTVIGPVDEASVEIVRRKLDTLGGLERQNQLTTDLADRDRHRFQNGQGPKE